MSTTNTSTTKSPRTKRRRFVRPLRLGALLMLVATLFTQIAAVSPAGAANELRYAGTTTTVVRTYDAYGRHVCDCTFTSPATTTIAAALQGDGNPFQLVVSPTVAATSDYGALSLQSSAVISAPSGRFVARYWDMDWVDGQTFQGTLVDSHARESVSANLVNRPSEIAPGLGWMSWPSAVAESTTVVGTFSSDYRQLTIEVRGTTSEGWPFVSVTEVAFG